jgi:hypothetical protein
LQYAKPVIGADTGAKDAEGEGGQASSSDVVRISNDGACRHTRSRSNAGSNADAFDL